MVEGLEQKAHEMFGEFDCGCENRREIMGAEDWQMDAAIIGAGIILVLIAILVLK